MEKNTEWEAACPRRLHREASLCPRGPASPHSATSSVVEPVDELGRGYFS